MGFLTRALVPRSVRRATHSVRTVRRAATPRSVKQAGRLLHPVSNAAYSVERSLNTKPRKRKAEPRKTISPQVVTNTGVVIDTERSPVGSRRFNEMTNGPPTDSTVWPDASDPSALIVTARVDLGYGVIQPVSRRVRVNPDGSWQVED